jgi:dTDP-4-amino-4,6-dideoxygalactose transaminase
MLTAISRYGGRTEPDLASIVEGCRRHGQLVQGPHMAAFEDAFSEYLGSGRAVAAPFGRMAFYYILKALQLPEGSEIIFPALTFWVMPGCGSCSPMSTRGRLRSMWNRCGG